MATSNLFLAGKNKNLCRWSPCSTSQSKTSHTLSSATPFLLGLLNFIKNIYFYAVLVKVICLTQPQLTSDLLSSLLSHLRSDYCISNTAGHLSWSAAEGCLWLCNLAAVVLSGPRSYNLFAHKAQEWPGKLVEHINLLKWSRLLQKFGGSSIFMAALPRCCHQDLHFYYLSVTLKHFNKCFKLLRGAELFCMNHL